MRRFADDDRPRARRLCERSGQHGSPAEDRAVGARIGGNVAAGQEAGARDHGARRALELVEVDVLWLGDEDGVDRCPVPAVDEPHPRPHRGTGGRRR
jgi:hypothetical protein